MNIFTTFSNPLKSAEILDDKRVIKMILESAQMLSTAMILDGEKGPYKVTHKNHPCSIWVREKINHFMWLTEHMDALCNEYECRYYKLHKCEQYLKYFYNYCNKKECYNDYECPLYFPNCTPFKEIEDTHLAYKYCLLDKWKNDKRIPKWYRINKTVEEQKKILEI